MRDGEGVKGNGVWMREREEEWKTGGRDTRQREIEIEGGAHRGRES